MLGFERGTAGLQNSTKFMLVTYIDKYDMLSHGLDIKTETEYLHLYLLKDKDTKE